MTPKISVIIPVYGNHAEVEELVGNLGLQTLKPFEIILVDSSEKPMQKPPDGVYYIHQPEDVSLAWNYNFGAWHATGDYILNMQQDCMPGDIYALDRLYYHLVYDPSRVAAVGVVTLPESVYDEYNYWGKVIMARWRGRVKQGISGKFDLILAKVFHLIGGYDTEHFSFAGEDMDLSLRLSRLGEVFVADDVEVIHFHLKSVNTTWRHLFRKHYLLAESFGALLRRHGLKVRKLVYAGAGTHHLGKFLYPLLLLLPFWPRLSTVAMACFSQFINVEAWLVRPWWPQVLANPILLLLGAAGTLVGLVRGKQTYSQNK